MVASVWQLLFVLFYIYVFKTSSASRSSTYQPLRVADKVWQTNPRTPGISGHHIPCFTSNFLDLQTARKNGEPDTASVFNRSTEKYKEGERRLPWRFFWEPSLRWVSVPRCTGCCPGNPSAALPFVPCHISPPSPSVNVTFPLPESPVVPESLLFFLFSFLWFCVFPHMLVIDASCLSRRWPVLFLFILALCHSSPQKPFCILKLWKHLSYVTREDAKWCRRSAFSSL